MLFCRCALWFKAINRTRLTQHTAEYCHTNLVLCSEHFDAKDVSLNTKRKRLNGYAIPIIRPLNIAQGEPSQSTTVVQQNQPNPSNEGNSEVLMGGSILSQVESLTSGEPSHSTTVVQENQPNPSDEGNSEVLMEGSILTEVESLTSVPEIEVGLPETTVLEETPSTSKLDTEKLSPQAGPSKEFQFSKTDVSTETSSFLSANTPRKIGLKRKVRQLAQQIRRSGGNQESSQKPDIMPQDVFNFFHEKYNPDIANFIAMQMNLLNKNPKGARYTSEYKQFAMTLYFLGPKCYKFLAKTLRLPSKSTLINITKKWPINPGLNDFVFNVLKNQVANMVEGSKDCILCIDEMSLKSNFHYNIARDELIGFHQTIDKKTFKPGNNALVLMLRGINSNWKQPLGYFFVNSTCPVEDLKTILFESIRRIDSVNLRLRIVVSDQGSNFFKLTNTLKITPENPYFMLFL